MKQLSYWASRHKMMARLLIIFSFFFLVLLGLFAGQTLSDLGHYLPSSFLYGAFLLLFLGLVFYPSRALKKVKGTQWFYRRQKPCDFALACVAFCLVLFYGNQMYTFSPTSNAIGASGLPGDSSKSYLSLRDFSKTLRDENGRLRTWKERKQLLKQQVKLIRHSKATSRTEKTLLVILSVLLALGLLTLVAALACDISCSGSAAGAAVVGILGTGLVIFLLILAIRGIYGRKRRRPRELHPPVEAN